ncbi:hypothetical protein AB9F39_38690, partial [Rhizobium leguminosarum]
GWVILSERVSRRTLIAGGISLFGVAVIVASSIGGGTCWGYLLALGMTASFALVIIIPMHEPIESDLLRTFMVVAETSN